MTVEIKYTERQQAENLAKMYDTLYRMAYGRNYNSMRYDAWEQCAMAMQHIQYAIDELKRLRCTDGEGLVAHDFFADTCTRCGQGLD